VVENHSVQSSTLSQQKWMIYHLENWLHHQKFSKMIWEKIQKWGFLLNFNSEIKKAIIWCYSSSFSPSYFSKPIQESQVFLLNILQKTPPEYRSHSWAVLEFPIDNHVEPMICHHFNEVRMKGLNCQISWTRKKGPFPVSWNIAADSP